MTRSGGTWAQGTAPQEENGTVVAREGRAYPPRSHRLTGHGPWTLGGSQCLVKTPASPPGQAATQGTPQTRRRRLRRHNGSGTHCTNDEARAGDLPVRSAPLYVCAHDQYPRESHKALFESTVRPPPPPPPPPTHPSASQPHTNTPKNKTPPHTTHTTQHTCTRAYMHPCTHVHMQAS